MSGREPLSWLTLERYALDELGVSERAEVDARLAESAADREVLAQIRADQSVLPALPTAVRRRVAWRAPALGGLGVCFAAAAAFLLMRAPPPAYDGVKGSGLGLRLISDRAGVDPTHFHEGERFKVELSCSAAARAPLRLFVYQGGERFEPLSLAGLACGNHVHVPGAFALDGSAPADVCVYAGDERAPTRSASGLVCAHLTAP